MKVIAWIYLVFSVSFAGSALAFDSQVSAGLSHWNWSVEEVDSGSTTEGDFTQDGIFANYTHFLTPVEDNGEPLDLLPFFYSRSSYVYGGIYTADREFEEDDSDYNSEKDWIGYRVGGLFYLTPTTGIGAALQTQSGDWKEENDPGGDDEYDEDLDGWNVWVRHYLDDHNRLSISLSETDRDRDFADGFQRSDKYEWFTLSYAGVLGESRSIFVGASIGDGSRDRDQSNTDDLDHDLTRYSITVGPVYRYFAIYFSYDYYDWDPQYDGWEAKETYFVISPRYWFSEQLMLGGDLLYYSWDESVDGRSDYDYEESGTEIEIQVRYRF